MPNRTDMTLAPAPIMNLSQQTISQIVCLWWNLLCVFVTIFFLSFHQYFLGYHPNINAKIIPLSSFSCLFSQALNYRSWMRSTLGPMHECVCVRVIWIVFACGCVYAMYIFVACECAGDTYASNTYLALECFYFFVLLFSFHSNRGYENSFMY